MRTRFASDRIAYTGMELSGGWIARNYAMDPPCILSFIGPCRVSPRHMMDIEDLRAGAQIRADRMLHFIVEICDVSIERAVASQFLLAEVVRDALAAGGVEITREGNDLFCGLRKLSVSIAARGRAGGLIHFGVNVSRGGVPVACAALEDWAVAPEHFALDAMERFAREMERLERAVRKVRRAG